MFKIKTKAVEGYEQHYIIYADGRCFSNNVKRFLLP